MNKEQVQCQKVDNLFPLFFQVVSFYRTVAILWFIPLCLLKSFAKEKLKSMVVRENSISKQLKGWEDAHPGRKVLRWSVEKGWLCRGIVGTARWKKSPFPGTMSCCGTLLVAHIKNLLFSNLQILPRHKHLSNLIFLYGQCVSSPAFLSYFYYNPYPGINFLISE